MSGLSPLLLSGDELGILISETGSVPAAASIFFNYLGGIKAARAPTLPSFQTLSSSKVIFVPLDLRGNCCPLTFDHDPPPSPCPHACSTTSGCRQIFSAALRLLCADTCRNFSEVLQQNRSQQRLQVPLMINNHQGQTLKTCPLDDSFMREGRDFTDLQSCFRSHR